ncbi:MAG: hypothetical protein LBD72_02970 [Puniceicoccales bacterium]|jgi:hypothetical protein|nr:hypothetical protein [Puniceicoccales bacterium]
MLFVCCVTIYNGMKTKVVNAVARISNFLQNIATKATVLLVKPLAVLCWLTIFVPAVAFARKLIVGQSLFWDFMVFAYKPHIKPQLSEPTAKQPPIRSQLSEPTSPDPTARKTPATTTDSDKPINPSSITRLSYAYKKKGEDEKFLFYAHSETCDYGEVVFNDFDEINKCENLKFLVLPEHSPAEVDVSRLKKLETLILYGTKIENIKFGSAPLYTLNIFNNDKLETLKLPSLPKGARLVIAHNTSLGCIDLNGQKVPLEKMAEWASGTNKSLKKITGVPAETFEEILNVTNVAISAVRKGTATNNQRLLLSLSFTSENGDVCESFFSTE